MNYRYSILGTCAWFCDYYQTLTYCGASYWRLRQNCQPCFMFRQGWGP